MWVQLMTSYNVNDGSFEHLSQRNNSMLFSLKDPEKIYKSVKNDKVSYFRASSRIQEIFYNYKYQAFNQEDRAKVKNFLVKELKSYNPTDSKRRQKLMGIISHLFIHAVDPKYDLSEMIYSKENFHYALNNPSITGEIDSLSSSVLIYHRLLKLREIENFLGFTLGSVVLLPGVSPKTQTEENKIVEIIEGQSSFEKVDVAAIENKIQNNVQLEDFEVAVVVEAKKRAVLLANTVGGVLDLFIIQIPTPGNTGYKSIENLKALSKLNSQQIDECLLQEFVQEHNVNRRENKVAVVGAGPSGLMASLKSYLKGDQVLLLNNRSEILEKNGEKYNLNQIVRLDSKWVAELQLYMGDDFQKAKKQGYAMMKSGGYVEIPIDQLVAMIKTRLVKIQSLEKENDLQIHYEMEVKDLKNGKIQTGKKGVDKVTEEHDYDALIFAGGANDKLRDKYLPSSPRTGAKRYSVSVFNKKPSHIDENIPFSNKNFRGRLKIQSWEIGILLAPENVGNDPVSQKAFELIHGYANYNLETRFFINRTQFYVGNEGVDFADSDASEEVKLKAQELIAMAVAIATAADHDVEIDLYEKDQNNSSTFVVQQKSAKKSAQIIEGNKFVAAVGDSLVTPHFFSGSGLSSSREEINNVIEALDQRAKKPLKEKWLEELEQQQQKAIAFTLRKGRPYLPAQRNAQNH